MDFTAVIICLSICFTFIACFAIGARIFYNLKINKDFKVKAKDIDTLINSFKNNYLDGYTHTDKSKMKYIGKPIDILNLIKTIEATLYNLK